MASSSRASSSRSSRSSGRSSYGGGRSGGGGGGNPAGVLVAIAALVVVIVLVWLVVKKGDKPKPAPIVPTVAQPEQPATPVVPKGPEKEPLPTLSAELVARAKALIPEFKVANEKGTALYNEAMKARQAGDQDTWQAKMEEGREILKDARDKWIVIEAEVQDLIDRKTPKGWTADEAVHALFDRYLGSESSQERTLIDEPLSRMAKTGRSH